MTGAGENTSKEVDVWHRYTIHAKLKKSPDKGKELFQKLDAELREQYYGKFMAIDAESGDYFLGATMIEADTQARAKYPGKVFYVGRIGYRAAIKYHGHMPLQGVSRR
jgi:hypothetical protein